MSVPEKIPLSELSRGDLEALTERLLAENAALKQVVADLRAGIVRLKGVTGRPAIRPSGAEDQADGQDRQAWRQTAQNWSLMRSASSRSTGSRFKGYEDFIVQDLVLRPRVVRIRRERRPTGTRADAGWGCRPL